MHSNLSLVLCSILRQFEASTKVTPQWHDHWQYDHTSRVSQQTPGKNNDRQQLFNAQTSLAQCAQPSKSHVTVCPVDEGLKMAALKHKRN